MESTDNSTRTNPSEVFTQAGAAAVFGEDCLDEKFCRSWILESLHPGGAMCPHCEERIVSEKVLNSFWLGKRCVCKVCDRTFTATSETFLQGSQLSYRQVFMLAVLSELMDQRLDLQRIAEALNISPDTVRIWRQRFKVINDK